MAELDRRPSAAPGALSALLAELVGAPERPPPAPWDRLLAAGARVGRFELVRELGRGGFGVVYEARDGELGRRVAFKAIRPGDRARDPRSEELMRREATAVAQLQHPNIVTLFDAGRSDAGPYLIFELLRGETLAHRLARGRLSSREALRVALAVARALVHAHANGVLHRDLKPSNVFLTADGGVKVLDFGLAHVFGAGGPPRSGTPGYMAPEQRRGAAEDVRTDVYALGVLLAEMVTDPAAAPPGTDVAALIAGARVPAPLAALAARCTRPEPAERPPDAAALADALVRVAEGVERSPRAVRADPGGGSPVEALRHFFRGEECQARPVFGQDCADHYRRAVALDPTLAVAHYQLAVWTRRFGASVAEQRAAMAAPSATSTARPRSSSCSSGRSRRTSTAGTPTRRRSSGRPPTASRRTGAPSTSSATCSATRTSSALAVPSFERAVALAPAPRLGPRAARGGARRARPHGARCGRGWRAGRPARRR